MVQGTSAHKPADVAKHTWLRAAVKTSARSCPRKPSFALKKGPSASTPPSSSVMLPALDDAMLLSRDWLSGADVSISMSISASASLHTCRSFTRRSGYM